MHYLYLVYWSYFFSDFRTIIRSRCYNKILKSKSTKFTDLKKYIALDSKKVGSPSIILTISEVHLI